MPKGRKSNRGRYSSRIRRGMKEDQDMMGGLGEGFYHEIGDNRNRRRGK